MANTFKFGNGKWAVKDGSTLAYNDENGNFKPLPFDFTRATSATRVNKDGLIEVVTNNKPRIDFLNDSNGALLLEPSATALNNFSEQINNAYWTKANCTVTADQTASPSGYVDAELVLDDTSNSQHVITRSIAVTSGNKYTASFFLKSAGYTTSAVRMGVGSLWTGGTGPTVEFDLVALTGTVVDGSGVTFNIEDYGNGWRRCSVTGTCVTSGSTVLSLYVKQYASYIGNGTDGVYAWGANITATGYATSYIPTQGGAVTRVAETCNQTPPSGIIGQTEGTVVINTTNFLSSGTRTLALFYTSIASYYQIYLTALNEVRVDVNGVFIFLGGTLVSGTQSKIAFAYKSGDFALYIDGVQVAISASATIPASLNDLYVGNSLGGEQIGGIDSFLLYDTRLPNAELQALTS